MCVQFDAAGYLVSIFFYPAIKESRSVARLEIDYTISLAVDCWGPVSITVSINHLMFRNRVCKRVCFFVFGVNHAFVRMQSLVELVACDRILFKDGFKFFFLLSIRHDHVCFEAG